MHRLARSVLVLVLSIATVRAQDALTADQRISDLTQLASQYAKNYAPYEWKRDVEGFAGGLFVLSRGNISCADAARLVKSVPSFVKKEVVAKHGLDVADKDVLAHTPVFDELYVRHPPVITKGAY